MSARDLYEFSVVTGGMTVVAALLALIIALSVRRQLSRKGLAAYCGLQVLLVLMGWYTLNITLVDSTWLTTGVTDPKYLPHAPLWSCGVGVVLVAVSMVTATTMIGSYDRSIVSCSVASATGAFASFLTLDFYQYFCPGTLYVAFLFGAIAEVALVVAVLSRCSEWWEDRCVRRDAMKCDNIDRRFWALLLHGGVWNPNGEMITEDSNR
jgi:hypothetical protein